ncbi:cytochrome c maturation protein CcmE [Rickettsiella grylli]|uniref:Cytochrome c-type biogenesis protein CcmE n=1 Tax=Rickettsiella grylli TaxID=59196 RepID=A8PN63_9COXI|nr:cytochrome c maturation protein CcmE [Rickettsiella grylli]EDP46717.1 cytoChrome c-type biogenesis protein CcmE (Cytochrome c maturationprotein E) (Heme chaperone ccmE) [Rickettsiella grylli]OIZ98892.1 hypothetical protein BEV13_06510 [Rickettsiella grylli]
MNGLQKKRLNFVVFLIVISLVVIGLSVYALKQNINLFYTPSQLVREHLAQGQLFHLGGQVKKGTVKQHGEPGLISFVVSDASHQVLVEYQGVLPDLFREGQSVVIKGSLDKNGILQAKQVLAKHDERYQSMP